MSDQIERFKDYEEIDYHLVYSELIKAARHQGTVTYQALAHVVGLPLKGSYMGRRIGDILGAVSQNEVYEGRPMLSAVAVNTRGEPGSGFYALAEQLDLLDPDATDDERAAFWEDQKQQAYEIWQQRYHTKK